MASYTTNYGLHQWESTDNFLRTDFNADHQLIDGAIKGAYDLAGEKAEVVAGMYTGDSAETRFIDLGFTPLWLLSFDNAGHSAVQGSCYGGLALGEHGVAHGSGYGVEIVEGGFKVGYSSPTGLWTNTNNTVYHYLACKA